jgi:hypothetical protein
MALTAYFPCLEQRFLDKKAECSVAELLIASLREHPKHVAHLEKKLFVMPRFDKKVSRRRISWPVPSILLAMWQLICEEIHRGQGKLSSQPEESHVISDSRQSISRCRVVPQVDMRNEVQLGGVRFGELNPHRFFERSETLDLAYHG